MIVQPKDQRTRLALQASYLETALVALRKAMALETGNDRLTVLTEATTTVAEQGTRIAQEYADIGHAQADVARSTLEA